MNVDSESVLAVLGLKLVNVVVGAVSSFTALRFFDGLSILDKWMTFLGGWTMSSYGATPLSEYLSLGPKVEIGIVLLLGLFGMSIAAEVIRLLKSISWDLLKELVRGK